MQLQTLLVKTILDTPPSPEGPFQGRVISAVVPDANQVLQWGL